MGNNWKIDVALSQPKNRGPNRLMGIQKLNTETAKTRERATPERAMIPSNEFIYIDIKKRRRATGTVDGATREERPPAVLVPQPGNARAEGGKWGEDKTGGDVFFNNEAEPTRQITLRLLQPPGPAA